MTESVFFFLHIFFYFKQILLKTSSRRIQLLMLTHHYFSPACVCVCYICVYMPPYFLLLSCQFAPVFFHVFTVEEPPCRQEVELEVDVEETRCSVWTSSSSSLLGSHMGSKERQRLLASQRWTRHKQFRVLAQCCGAVVRALLIQVNPAGTSTYGSRGWASQLHYNTV